MPSLVPSATYESPLELEAVRFVPGEGPHSTDGKTTRISDIVIGAGGTDRDKPSAARDTDLGGLRARLTTVQDQLNEFLTSKMRNKRKLDDAEADVERRLLDEGVDEDSD
ncbi:hypothetical protein METBIDRAFT_43295 [Metschnikowia bicuspidata var. bicuspidata NRRL YB-4993]|uniref:EKC/KEOPS complex subunit GON7 n=1 Tax=Metschnikowia bicuspidata var. bicuspidata NRRL YB-4993 TaxID=869754 RepID=A0A1A0H8Z0_9ASCO|nr:hypothetical protein METBIDRAFT_43295 [Metschnikowia bicuspidata var. bicuspidata NRRL YB-4993]OBA20348.1 hypothetical protein METBIDRAFT_43295 [Metschnikowia bicuspidata var. bicuspidata NRRL YB-4993]